MSDYLWDKSGSDPEIAKLEHALAPLRYEGRLEAAERAPSEDDEAVLAAATSAEAETAEAETAEAETAEAETAEAETAEAETAEAETAEAETAEAKTAEARPANDNVAATKAWPWRVTALGAFAAAAALALVWSTEWDDPSPPVALTANPSPSQLSGTDPVAHASSAGTARPPGPSWAVHPMEGPLPLAQGDGRLHVGEWLETEAGVRARVDVAEIGTLDVGPASRLRLLNSSEGEHRVELAQGSIHAVVTAPPRLFIVDTPTASAVDLGCEYTLEVDDDASNLCVSLGWVALERDGMTSYVPAGACSTSRGGKIGLPVFKDAPEPFAKAALAMDAGQIDVAELIRSARRFDSVTLWHVADRLGAQGEPVRARLRHLGLPSNLDMKDEAQVLQAITNLFEEDTPDGPPQCISTDPSCESPGDTAPPKAPPQPTVHW